LIALNCLGGFCIFFSRPEGASTMLSAECIQEFQGSWLPNITDLGLERLIELLDKQSPLLIHGSFTRSMPMGCLASHAAWHHPVTAHLNLDAGISWLYQVAGLNPGTSAVLREWDRHGGQAWELRAEVLELLLAERRRRQGMLDEVSPSAPTFTNCPPDRIGLKAHVGTPA
jgi:hypothetical protein